MISTELTGASAKQEHVHVGDASGRNAIGGYMISLFCMCFSCKVRCTVLKFPFRLREAGYGVRELCAIHNTERCQSKQSAHFVMIGAAQRAHHVGIPNNKV